ncbi:MAG: hypothetical protein DI544_00040 [Sphingomonas taxi]|uniref:Sulfotransferase family protein n=1 Tax=Sphingomonas taxi TaxID=1549858 RepID=A0A2W5QX75_9SPHN|nr:MAG: hypothetical protein DI544_00040 [Sphingomonas taxi]
MSLTIADLLASPDHYLQRFDGAQAVFVPMDRAAYHRSIFLDARIAPAAAREMRVPVAMLGTPPPMPPVAWIFHVAHCGSTLLARALDDMAGGLVLREPQALRQAALAGDPARLSLAAAMAARRYRADAPTLVKANVPVNFVLPELARMQPDARAILLFLPLRDYVLAILRSDNHRAWLRRVTEDLAARLGDLSGKSDARRAAALWGAQMRLFAGALRAMPQARSLEAERFFAEPATVLRAAARHLAMPFVPEALDAVAAGPLFSTYSKNPAVAFDNDARLERRAALERALAGEVAEAEDRAGGVGDEVRAVMAAALV